MTKKTTHKHQLEFKIKLLTLRKYEVIGYCQRRTCNFKTKKKVPKWVVDNFNTQLKLCRVVPETSLGTIKSYMRRDGFYRGKAVIK